MNTCLRLALCLAFASAGCTDPEQVEADSGVADACVPTATLPAATCAEGVLSRYDEPTGLSAGPATVVSLGAEADGRVSLVLEAGGVSTTLSLPAAPMVTAGDTVTVELAGSGAIILRSGTDLLAYIGPRQLSYYDPPAMSDTPVGGAVLLAANRGGVPLSIEVVGVPLTLEAACGGWVPHHASVPYGCPDVAMAAFSVRHEGTTVAPGACALAPLAAGLALAIENRGVHVREESTCLECGDAWQPGFGVTLVITAAE